MYLAPIPENEQQRLATLRRYEILDSDREIIYDDITHLARYICGTEAAMVTLVDTDRQWFKSETGVGLRETERPTSFCATAMLQPGIMLVEDTHLDERYRDNPLVTSGPQVRFYAGAPLVTSDGFALGTLCVVDPKPRTLDAAQLAALQSLARQVMALLELRLRERERERLTKAVRNAEKLAALGRLSAVIAHELNNPLDSIANLVFLARQSGSLAETEAYLEGAERELRRAAAVTRQTLRFHRQSTRPAAVPCGQLFDTALFGMEARLLNAGVVAERRLRCEQTVVCYEGEIGQVLNNLIGNAVDAMSPGGGRLLLRTRASTHWPTGRKGLTLTVADTGAGMSRETMSNLFEPFFTTKGITGNGLGLWITQDIVGRHHGAIAIRSSRHAERHGTVFSVFLPSDTAAR